MTGIDRFRRSGLAGAYIDMRSRVLLPVLAHLVVLSYTRASTTTLTSSWEKDTLYYHLLVDSFKDSDGDGLGDLPGATKQISYVRALGAEAVVLSPLVVFSSDCSRPGPTDLSNIDGRYGTMAQFTAFLEKAELINVKVVVTLPLQTISSASEWFNSSASRSVGFEDWVLWRDGEAEQEPLAEENISWKWHASRGAWWGARNDEAVLNLCSAGLSAALATAQCAWIRRGVSGVLVLPDFSTEPRCAQQLMRKMISSATDCARSANLNTPIVLIESALNMDKAAELYDESTAAHGLLNNALAFPSRPTTPELALRMQAGLLYSTENTRPVWLTSWRNCSRITTRYGTEMVDTINLLALMLPGSVMVQQGDELGTADTLLEWVSSESDKCWPNSRHPSAAPLPWDDTTNGGFSAAEPWMPLAPNYRYANAKSEFGSDTSHAGVFRVAAAMRRSPAMGPYVDIVRLGEALAILRWGGVGTLLLVCNPSHLRTEIRMSAIPALPNEMTVAASSAGSTFGTGTHVQTDRAVKMGPGEAVLLAGPPRSCGGPGPVDKIANKLTEGWQKLNKYFSNI